MAAMRESYRQFISEQYDLVVRFLMRMGACLADAEDSTQNMALQGWRKVQSGGWEQIANPQAWARKVALNDYRGKCRRRCEFPLDVVGDRPEPGPGHAELTGQARDLVALLQCLDPMCREVIAYDLDGIPGPDMAFALGISQQKVRDLRAKARRHLKRHLAAQTEYGGRGGV